jgi:hypothetical protein
MGALDGVRRGVSTKVVRGRVGWDGGGVNWP